MKKSTFKFEQCEIGSPTSLGHNIHLNGIRFISHLAVSLDCATTEKGDIIADIYLFLPGTLTYLPAGDTCFFFVFALSICMRQRVSNPPNSSSVFKREGVRTRNTS